MGATDTDATSVRASARVDAFDGVRALAILAVLACHLRLAGVPFRDGGYLGVDIFFVLSGFLITSLLIDERRRHGRVSLANFFTRRFLRIMPVLFLLVAIGAAVFVFASPSYDMRPSSVAFAAAPAGWMNWLEILRPDATGMLGHTWSLAVEMQFYVVFPLALLAAWTLRCRSRTIASALIVGIGAVVATRMYTWMSAPPVAPLSASPVERYLTGLARGHVWSRWYFGSFTHTDGLLVGALLAVVLAAPRVGRRLVARPRLAGAAAVAALATVGAVIAGAASSRVSAFVPMVGLLLLESAVAMLLASLVVVPSSRVANALGSRPMVWIGRRSYAMYLLHIPVWMLVVELGLGGVVFPPSSSVGTGWLTVVLTFVVAQISFVLIERPAVRARHRFGTQRIRRPDRGAPTVTPVRTRSETLDLSHASS